MTVKQVQDADRVASHPDKEINMKTLCVGILTKKILPGARVIATGRNTEAVNSDILENKAAMYELVAMDANDRGIMIDLMEQNPRDWKVSCFFLLPPRVGEHRVNWIP